MIRLPAWFHPPQASALPQVVFLPASGFVVRELLIDAPMSEHELESFVELSLEECSPFPLDQLAWGFHVQPGRVIAFATPRSQIEAVVSEHWEEYTHVYPAFLPLLPGVGEAHACGLLNGHELTVAIFNELGGSIQLPLGNTIVEEDQLPEQVAIGIVLQHGHDGHEVHVPILRIVGSGVTPDGQVFLSSTIDWSSPQTITLEEELAWHGDLRSRDFVRRHWRELTMGRKVWVGVVSALGVAATLLVLSLISWFMAQLNANDRALIASREAAVEMINNNQLQIDKLDTFTADPFEPFAWLEAINSMRPRDQIWFDTVSIDPDGEIFVKGFADQVNQVNNFVRSLIRSGKFKESETTQFSPRNNKIQFQMRLVYLQGNPSGVARHSLAVRRGEPS